MFCFGSASSEKDGRKSARPLLPRMLGALLSAALFAAPFSAVAAASHEVWVPTWSTAPHSGDTAFNNQTIRMVVRTTLGGNKVRIQLSNLFGTAPLAIGAAHVALLQKGSAIAAGTDRALTFGGKPSTVIPAGVYALSDPVDLAVPQLGNLAVSVFVPSATSGVTSHVEGLRTTYISPPGDFAAAAEMPQGGSTTLSYYLLTAVYVTADRPVSVVVAMGDSITDGALSTPNTDSPWPGVLGKILINRSKHPHLVVLNEGIGGNRILRDIFGPSALARLDRDAFDQPGVSTVILLEGINDIGYPFGGRSQFRDEIATPADLIQAMQQIIARCHLHKIKIIGGTLTPLDGAAYSSPTGLATRDAVNRWIRGGGGFDAVVDFDKAIEDPAQPDHFLPAYDSGDHLHPNDAGYKAMADAAATVLEHMPR